MVGEKLGFDTLSNRNWVFGPGLEIHPNDRGKIVCLIVLFSSICIILIIVCFLFFFSFSSMEFTWFF
jgi:hypothetical protein